jgi:hypothetical protein
MIDSPLTDKSTVAQCDEWIARLNGILARATDEFEAMDCRIEIAAAEKQRAYVASRDA